jgi:DNA polymerase V
MYALVDCNNFFVSCERAFRPDIQKVPVAVLSNNDGCIVSRSQEVKDMGIPMGIPYFQCRDIFRKHGVKVFSSNFTLYGDLSHRVMDTLHYFTDDIEIYSIDEAFLTISPTQAEQYCREVKKTVEQWTHIPVSIGIGPTKVLAKVANHIAKKNKQYGGVYMVKAGSATEHFTTLPTSEIWGIGRKSANHLARLGVNTVAELLSYSDEWIRHELSVTGLQIAYELRGIPCFGFDDSPSPKKAIMCSRSFGEPITNHRELEEAIVTYTGRAAEKLRQGHQVAKYLSIFIRTKLHGANKVWSARQGMILPTGTSSTPILVSWAVKLLRDIYKDKIRYGKAGVCCADLVPENLVQSNLLEQLDTSKHRRIMDSFDKINRRFGRDTIFMAGGGTTQPWTMRKEFISPQYTTSLSHIPIVKA